MVAILKAAILGQIQIWTRQITLLLQISVLAFELLNLNRL